MGATKRRPKMGINPKKYALARASDAKVSVESAMLAAGYSPATAKKGRAKLSRACILAEREALAAKAEELRRFGVMTPQEQEALVRGRLAQNVTRGEDGGAQSAKLLGQDRHVNMFTPYSISGVIVLEMPKSLPPLDLPILEGDVSPQLSGETAEQEVYLRLHNDAGWRASAEGQAALRDLHSKPEWKPRFAGCNPNCAVCFPKQLLEAAK